MAILISVFSAGYHGKSIDLQKYSPCHRTTVAHFLNKGKWDGTIASKTKPSSRALHPLEVFFRQSKDKLAFDQYQVRSSKEIQRYWLLMSLAHFIACPDAGKICPLRMGMLSFTAISKRNVSNTSINVE